MNMNTKFKKNQINNYEPQKYDGTYLLNDTDVKIFIENADKIVKNAQKMKMNLVEPYKEEIKQINEVVIQYIKDNRRKIYGGYALNLLLTNKDEKLALYSDTDIPDIDFYSPEPIKDLIKICNLLHAKGYKNVSGKEALHKETYSVRVNNQLYCDITYVPRNIYNKMPFIEINSINVIGPEFMIIDYFRLLTDLLLTNWRLEKTVKRMFLLQKAYPLPYVKSSLEISQVTGVEKDDFILIYELMKQIQRFCENNKYAVLVGIYAYNHFLNGSGILQSTNNRFKYVEVPNYEIILTEYKDEALKLINLLKTKTKTVDDIHIVEYYPFFQFFGNSVEIYYKTTLLARLYTNNKKCIPFRYVKPYYFENNKMIIDKENNKHIMIGSFSMTILYSLIAVMKARVNDEQYTKNLHYMLISHITEFKNYYFKTMNKSLVDRTLFEEFIVECVGIPVTPEHERQLLIDARKKKNKKYTFSYDPSQNIIEDLNYVFSNSSGNTINYLKNLKLTNTEIGNQYDDDFDEDEPNIVLM